ncbi:HNH endonuclease signature motif containing protein [Nocardioides sp.]|uniref:HNH endonuclease signature motif containing protein n=1 Tax=Nocardioides sp. TaxID=35761 RepID=UPI002737086C|nr:HNH endonuclease signature motif containing protein [Nocardioides sp.]MDP3892245.1 HNH endonuclease signature motif containing protein [Nocardioides sp.]
MEALLDDADLDTADAVLDDARELRRIADRADALLLKRACQWADQHPVLEDDGTPALDEFDLPLVSWRATAEFAINIGLSEDAGTRLIRESLELRQRLPRIWTRIMTGQLQAWRARRIAQTTLGTPHDVADHIDTTIAPIAHKIGVVKLDRLLDEAMLRLHPEEHEQAQFDAQHRRRVKLFAPGTPTGLAQMVIDADLKDLHDFDAMVSTIAAALKDQGCPESLDVRRAMAVGILADPHNAATLLDHGITGTPRRKQIVLHVHLSHAAILGLDVVGRSELGGGHPVLEQQIRDWCGRTDTALRVLPVIDLNDHVAVDRYEIPDRLKTRIDLLHGTCIFPFCTRPARRCDHDHTIPHAAGGATCDCNLTPLCRRHHRLKTLAGWRYTTFAPGEHLWTTPWGRSYYRDPTGTTVLPAGQPPPDRPPPGYTGCLIPSQH